MKKIKLLMLLALLLVVNFGFSQNIDFDIDVQEKSYKCDSTKLYWSPDGVDTGVAPYSITWVSILGDTITGIDTIIVPHGVYFYATVIDLQGLVAGSGAYSTDYYQTADTHIGVSGCDEGGVVYVFLEGPGTVYQWSQNTPPIDSGTAYYAAFMGSTGGGGDIRSGLEPGVYSVIATNDAGCVVSYIDTVAGVAPLNFCLEAGENCDGNDTLAVHLSQSSGGNISYLWNTGDTTSWVTGPPSVYSVTVTDNISGCSKYLSDTLIAYQTFNPILDISNDTCFATQNAYVIDSLTGLENLSWSYQWSGLQPSVWHQNIQPHDTLMSVVVTNGFGCADTDTLSIPIFNPIPLGFVVDSVGVQQCSGDSIFYRIVAKQGTSVNLWGVGSTASVFFTDTLEVFLMPIGGYVAALSNSAGCSQGEVIAVVSTALPITTVVVPAGHDHCGVGNGYLTMISSGGSGGFTYLINGNPVFPASGNTTFGLHPGQHVVTTTDGNGCSRNDTATIAGPSSPQSVIVAYGDVCDQQMSVSISVVGGTAPYVFTTSTTSGIQASASGLFLLAQNDTIVSWSVVDSLGCASNGIDFVPEANPITIAATVFSGACHNDSSKIEVVVSISTSGTTQSNLWLVPNQNGDTLAGFILDSVNLFVVNESGCFADTTLYPMQPDSLVTQVANQIATCGDANGLAQIVVTGGAAPYPINWSNGVGGFVLDSAFAGSYLVSVMDANGCLKTDSVTIGSSPAIEVDVYDQFGLITDDTSTVGCFGDASQLVFSSATDVSFAVSGSSLLSWVQTSPFGAAADALAGWVTWQASDSFGCVLNDTIIVVEPAELVVGMGPSQLTGFFEIQVSGGTAPYDTLYTLNGMQQPNPLPHTNEGLYKVMITDVNGCVVTAGFYLYAVGTQKVLSEQVRVYPSPVSSSLSIDFGSFDGKKTIEIFSVTGQLQLVKTKIATEGEVSVDIDMSDFVTGTYLVRIVAADQVATQRVIKN